MTYGHTGWMLAEVRLAEAVTLPLPAGPLPGDAGQPGWRKQAVAADERMHAGRTASVHPATSFSARPADRTSSGGCHA
jgi:hypothetical protein